MRKTGYGFLSAILCLALLGGCGSGGGVSNSEPSPNDSSVMEQDIPSFAERDELEAEQSPAAMELADAGIAAMDTKPEVYYTSDISAEGLQAVYEALNREATGNVAFKISTGEAGSYYLRPELIGGLVQSVSGTIVESNTAYGGPRASAAMHMQLARDHGYTEIAAVDIQDTGGSISLPVANGRHLNENLVGITFPDYDFYVILSHFKGHRMGGFGGAIKNMSVGIASSSGKCLIHSAGASSTDRLLNTTPQDDFLESMAESAKTISDYLGNNILYINVMNNLSVDCDCNAYPSHPEMDDIGILASLDPVALDQACVDLVYAAESNHALVERMESRHAVRTLEYSAEIGLGSREYTLVSLDS